MLEKNCEYEGIIADVGAEGEGVIKVDNCIVFLPYGIVGEKVRYKVLKTTSKFAYGKILEVLTPAEIRVRPQCKVFEKCGGCQLQHIKYANQLKIKEDNIAKCFKKIANLDVEIASTVKSVKEYEYRNKLQLPVGQGEEGAIIGFYANNSHRIVPIDCCPINADWTTIIIKSFKTYFAQNKIKGYNEVHNTGDVREVTVKEVGGNLMITVVSLTENLPNIKGLIEILKSNLKCQFSLFVNVNNKKTNVVYGDKFICVYGEKDYSIETFGIKHKMGVQSFMQVNNDVCLKLYTTVKEVSDLDEDTTVIDAYSGAGLMTALLSLKAKKAYGIEIVKEAVDCANELVDINALSNKITNICGKCEDILPSLIMEEKLYGNKICLVLDPPRKGCDIKVINSILQSLPDRIVYVSCKPSTLARDIGLIVGSLKETSGEIKRVEEYIQNYAIELVKPFDMFAQTKHVETLVVLRKTIKHEMKLKPEPFDMMKSGKKTIELRLLDEKRSLVNVGDTIEFTNTSNGEKITTLVKKIYRFGTFEELYKNLPLLKCGYTEDNIDTASHLDMDNYYSMEEQKEYGVVGIEIGLIK